MQTKLITLLVAAAVLNGMAAAATFEVASPDGKTTAKG